MSTKILSFDRAINNTIQWIDDIQNELGWESREDTYKATKAVLQALRDRLPVEEVVHLCANLPLVMKGMLMDGYDLKNKPSRMRSIEEFDEAVQKYYDGTLRNLIFSEDAASAVLRVLNRRIGGGEMRKVASTMPERLRRLFEPAIIKDLRREIEATP